MTVIGYKIVSCVDTSHEGYTGPQRDVGPVLVSPNVIKHESGHSGEFTPLVYAAHREVAAQNYCPDADCANCGGIYFWVGQYGLRRQSMPSTHEVAAIEVLDADGAIQLTDGVHRARSVRLGRVVPMLPGNATNTSGYLAHTDPLLKTPFLMHYRYATLARFKTVGVGGGSRTARTEGLVERPLSRPAYEWLLTEDGEMLFATVEEAAATEHVASWQERLRARDARPAPRSPEQRQRRKADQAKLDAWMKGSGIVV